VNRTFAYQLWLDDGCPVGSHQEDWFRARTALSEAGSALGLPPGLSWVRGPSVSRHKCEAEGRAP
jgi:hypothetical protein